MVNKNVYEPERQDASGGFRSGDEEERKTELTVREARGRLRTEEIETPETETKNE